MYNTLIIVSRFISKASSLHTNLHTSLHTSRDSLLYVNTIYHSQWCTCRG